MTTHHVRRDTKDGALLYLRRAGPGAEHAANDLLATDARPTKILLAEDDLELRQLLAMVLRRAGYDVEEVADGSTLLRELADEVGGQKPFDTDLIISDILMPGWTGLNVLAGLRRFDWAVPVILITAFGDAETHAEAARLGAVTVLDKPFDVDDLLRVVRDVMPPSVQ